MDRVSDRLHNGPMNIRYLSHRVRPIAVAALLAMLCSGLACKRDKEKKAAATPADAAHGASAAMKAREQALAAARVWTAPALPIGQFDFRENPPGPGAIRADEELACTFRIEPVGGTTSKFYCELPSGELVKVKYGSINPELHAEVAATRLLTALGFGTDRMYVVKRVRCAGCPAFPFQALKCLKKIDMKAACFPGGIDTTRVVDFDTAVIERRIEGRKIEGTQDQGWAWYELDKVDAAQGGSPLAQLDALRLLAVVLAHWDNKSENQRLICPPDAEREGGGCSRPVAIVQDLGATFGPKKVDLHNWRNYPVWTDPAACAISMKSLPYAGATFVDRKISEAGRALLLGWLEQLTDQQLRDLFEGSHITDYDQVTAEARSADVWVAAFKDKVAQIRKGGPCPPVTAS